MAKLVHIFKENLLQIQDYKALGWKETKRFGDLVEMQEPEQQKVVKASKTMLTNMKSGIERIFKWKS